MKKSSLLALICVALGLAAQTASAQYIEVVAEVDNNFTYEDGVFGATAGAGTTLYARSGTAPSWTSPSSFPIFRSTGQTATWGYANSTPGSTLTGGYASGFNLSNVAFRNVVRGSNNTGNGLTSGFQTFAYIANTTNCSVDIWGNAQLSLVGVTGAQNYSASIFVDGAQKAFVTRSGGASYLWTYSLLNPNAVNEIRVVIYANSSSELGSVLVNHNL